MGSYVLGIDNGGTSTKAVLFNIRGEEIALAKKNTLMLTPHPGHTERDMEELWKANCDVIRQVIDESRINPKDVVGISFSGHGKGLYLWGKDNIPARPGIISTDSRAYAIVDRWTADGTAARAFLKTCQSILASQPVALLKWVMDNEPDVLKKTQWIFGVKDYLRYRMTGEAYAEITDISGSSLLNLYTRSYDEQLLGIFGLEEVIDKMPPLILSSQFCGKVTADCARITNLVEGTPVAGGLFDIDACAIGMNVVNDEYIAVIAGTWSINEYISSKPIIDHSVKMNSLYCIPGYYLIEECSPTSASNQEWFLNNFLKESGVKVGESLYKTANSLVESVKPNDQSIVFLPYLYGGSDDASARAAFVGIDNSNSLADILRSIYECIIFGHKKHIDRLLKSRSTSPKAVRLAGGVVNSPTWVQMFADILELPVETIAVKELGALGAAMTAAVAAGAFDCLEDAANTMVKVDCIYKPNNEYAGIYQQKYKNFCIVDDVLADVWHRLIL